MLANPPTMAACLDDFVSQARRLADVRLIAFEPRARVVVTVIQAPDMDREVSGRIIDLQHRCASALPKDEAPLTFRLVNLGNFPEDQRPETIDQFRSLKPLYAAA